MPGWLAFQEAPMFGIDRKFEAACDDIAGSSLYDCHPHPHNYYIQMIGEAGIVGDRRAVSGSIIWAAFPRCVTAAMLLRRCGLCPLPFWPIASTADFFGQWNNIFMWSAVAVALAGAQIGSQESPASKG